MLLIKIKQQDLLRDSKYIFNSITNFTRVNMICFIYSSASQLALYIGQSQARAKLSAFEYENKESRESSNHIKRSNWSFFKEAPYRNLDMSQQP